MQFKIPFHRWVLGCACLLLATAPALAQNNWSDQFGVLGANKTVRALALEPSGDMYIGGDFDQVSGTTANYVALWDAQTHLWETLPGLNGTVRALALTAGGTLYAGGDFSGHLARWDAATSTWQTVGHGTSGPVHALAFASNGDLYVGGNFTTVNASGTTPLGVNNIAKWDGTGWAGLVGSSAGVGHSGSTVFALGFASNGDLYVGGDFTTAGGTAQIYHLARYNSGTWSAVGNGTDKPVRALGFGANDTLYVGGDFTTVNFNGGSTVSANYVARFDGTSWSTLGSGATNGVNKPVRALQADGSTLYVGGDFTLAGGSLRALHVARWNGHSWANAVGGSALNEGLDGPVHALALGDDLLHAGGDFTKEAILGTAATNAARIAAWDTGSLLTRAWSAIPGDPLNGLDGIVEALVVHGSDLYAGGDFSVAGRAGDLKNTNGRMSLARYDGTRWHDLGFRIVGRVTALAVDSNGHLYVGGVFEFVNGGTTPFNSLARYDGATWHTLGSGADTGVQSIAPGTFGPGEVEALAVNGLDVYVGGQFLQAGNQHANRVAHYHPTNGWAAMGTGADNRVLALTVDAHGTVYAGGEFQQMDGTTVNHVAQWNGTAWSGLADHRTGTAGTNDAVTALAHSGLALYVGGRFTQAGGQTAQGVAYIGSSQEWTQLGGGVTSIINSLALYFHPNVLLPDVYVGGETLSSGGVIYHGIMKYDWTQWSDLSGGVTGQHGAVEALAVGHLGVYAGGVFEQAGGKSSSHLAHWRVPLLSIVEPTIRFPFVPYTPGETVFVPLEIEIPQATGDQETPEIRSVEITAKIPEAAYFNEPKIAGAFIGALGWSHESNRDGQTVRFAAAGATPLAESGTLVFLELQMDASAAGRLPLEITAVTLNDGSLRVRTENAELFPAGEGTGDLDGNGDVQAFDAAQILQFVTGDLDLTEAQQQAGDVTGDGAVTPLDASAILQHVVGLIDQLPLAPGALALATDGTLTMPDAAFRVGEIIEIPLHLTNGTDILAFDAAFHFDPAVLRFEGITGADGVGFATAVRQADGVLHIAGADTQRRHGEGLIAHLRFTALAETETEVALTQLRWNEEAPLLNVATAHLSPEVSTSTEGVGGLPTAFRLDGAYPNPFNPATTLRFDLPQAAEVTLAVYDLLGREVQRLHAGTLAAGAGQQLRFAADGLASGSYLYRLTARFADGVEMQTGRFVLLK